jgi:hypothetical protein
MSVGIQVRKPLWCMARSNSHTHLAQHMRYVSAVPDGVDLADLHTKLHTWRDRRMCATHVETSRQYWLQQQYTDARPRRISAWAFRFTRNTMGRPKNQVLGVGGRTGFCLALASLAPPRCVQFIRITVTTREIWGSHDGKYDCCFMWCDAVWSGGHSLTFRKNVLTPFQGTRTTLWIIMLSPLRWRQDIPSKGQ